MASDSVHNVFGLLNSGYRAKVKLVGSNGPVFQAGFLKARPVCRAAPPPPCQPVHSACPRPELVDLAVNYCWPDCVGVRTWLSGVRRRMWLCLSAAVCRHLDWSSCRLPVSYVCLHFDVGLVLRALFFAYLRSRLVSCDSSMCDHAHPLPKSQLLSANVRDA
jgi:hypothetical protein